MKYNRKKYKKQPIERLLKESQKLENKDIYPNFKKSIGNSIKKIDDKNKLKPDDKVMLKRLPYILLAIFKFGLSNKLLLDDIYRSIITMKEGDTNLSSKLALFIATFSKIQKENTLIHKIALSGEIVLSVINRIPVLLNDIDNLTKNHIAKTDVINIIQPIMNNYIIQDLLYKRLINQNKVKKSESKTTSYKYPYSYEKGILWSDVPENAPISPL